jgi:hydroxyacylglutathione hydrolase
VGSTTTDDAIVIDPNLDFEQYIKAAADERLRITYVAETHIHADFVSGARALAAQTGARLLLSGEGGNDWKYAFAAEDGAHLLHDGDAVRVGDVQLDVIHTPGHTPEHIVLVVTDTSSANCPMGIFTGDFVFVGDVGRPDLLERAAHVAGSMDGAARQLFHSLRRLRDRDDYLQLWPGHGAGSACGKSLGAVPSTTLGYERRFNWAFSINDEDEFVRMVLAGQPEPPKYFASMKHINRDGPPASTPGTRTPRRLDVASLEDMLRLGEAGPTVVDTRPPRAFGGGFVRGTINIPAGKSFTNWAGTLLPADRDIALIIDGNDEQRAQSLAKELLLIGFGRVTAWGGRALLDEWQRSGRELEQIPTVESAALATRPDLFVIDVRGDAEWDAGHIPGAKHLFLGTLLETSARLPRDLPIVVHCQGGSRSSIAASLLHANGFTDVINLPGGFGEWKAAGLPVETSEAEPSS